jgi:CRISPR-associated protein Csb2
MTPQSFRWRLAGTAALPKLTQAAAVGIAVRAAVQRSAEQRGGPLLPDVFHRSEDHSHAFWIAEDADEDGYIDHVLVFAESGLPKAVIPILAEADKVFLGGGGEWQLIPNWMGQRSQGGLFGPANVWRSMSAYIPPWWHASRKGGKIREKYLPANQLRKEIVNLRQRRLSDTPLPEPVQITLQKTISCQVEIPASDFVTTFPDPARTARRPKDALAIGAEIIFDRPVWGPLAFGYGAHFGLGVFEPISESSG